MGFFDQFKAKPIKRAKIIGVRTGEQTKTITTENFGVYSFLVEHEDGSVSVREAVYRSDAFDELMKYVKYEE